LVNGPTQFFDTHIQRNHSEEVAKMKHASKFFSLLALTALVSFPAVAQNAGSQQENNTPQQQEKTHSQDANGNPTQTRKSVTGCLQKADKSGTYSIKTDNGATWLLKSRKVDLSEHVGHQVTATGFLRENQTTQTPSTPNTTVDNAQDEAGAGGAGIMNTLHVVNLKMVSETCSTK
jgi:hypothetical protein